MNHVTTHAQKGIEEKEEEGKIKKEKMEGGKERGDGREKNKRFRKESKVKKKKENEQNSVSVCDRLYV